MEILIIYITYVSVLFCAKKSSEGRIANTFSYIKFKLVDLLLIVAVLVDLQI